MHVQDDVLYNACLCNDFQFTIHLMIVGLTSTALFQYLKRQDQQISKNVEALSYCAVHEISEGGPFFTFSLPGGRAPLPPRELRDCPQGLMLCSHHIAALPSSVTDLRLGHGLGLRGNPSYDGSLLT